MERALGPEVFQEQRRCESIGAVRSDVVDVGPEILEGHLLREPPLLPDRLHDALLTARHEPVDPRDRGRRYAEPQDERHKRPPPGSGRHRRRLRHELRSSRLEGLKRDGCRRGRRRRADRWRWPRSGLDDAVGDPAALHPQPAIGDRGDGRIVGHDDDRRRAHFPDLGEEAHDLRFGESVEVVGRLVGEDQARLRRQGPCQRHPALLAAGELGGMGVPALPHPHPRKPRLGSCAGRFAGVTSDELWQDDVVERR